MEFGVLRQREFRLVFCAHGVSVFGDRMVAVALAFAVLGVGGTATDVGLVLAARMLPLVASLLAGGVVADRASRRAVMVTTDLTRLATQGALAALLIAGDPPIWAIAVLSGLTGAATGFFSPASTGLLPAVVEPKDLQQANGLRATVMAGGEIAGPALAGVLVATVGAGWAIGIDAATFGLSAAFLANLHLPRQLPRAGGSFLTDLKEGWTAFRSRRWVWLPVLIFGLTNMVWSAWGTLGPVAAEQDLGGAAAWGTVLAVLGVGALAGGMIAVRVDPARPLVVFAVGSLAFAAPLALLAAEAPLPVIAFGAFLAGISLMLGNSLWESTLQRHIPAESLSRVSAYDWFGSFAFGPIGYAIWGPIADRIGLEEALWLAAALLLALVAPLLAIRELRELPAFPPATALAGKRTTR
jgi:MFS family permease